MATTKPFLILQLRPEDEAADDELNAFIKFGKINGSSIHRVRLEKESIPDVDLSDYSAVLIGGGPSNVSDSEQKKSKDQKRFETELFKLLDKVVEQDFPLLGGCYGIGILAKYLGGKISKKYGEPVGAISINLTEEASSDPLTKDLPNNFKAFAGHKEAVESVPSNVTVLGGNKDCPIQIIRFKKNIYATQFHTELDKHGMALRINIYKHAGYFPPEDADKLIAMSFKQEVTEPEKILNRFVERYSKTI